MASHHNRVTAITMLKAMCGEYIPLKNIESMNLDAIENEEALIDALTGDVRVRVTTHSGLRYTVSLNQICDLIGVEHLYRDRVWNSITDNWPK